ncbi:DUF1569 domain-containing protein [Winogradskyella maritima]|uniref:DUF1569 domain-containing protein n=1 Tax=Winogradskyella maritima TaxID=1517766 RepID=A0ABV8ALG7_9FLAO
MIKSYFDEGAHEEITTRIQKLNADMKPGWGQMNAGQMVHHCQIPLNVILQTKDYGLKPNWLAKTFFKKAMYSDKLWRKNLPTMPNFRVTEDKDFNTEKQELLRLLNELYSQRQREEWQDHPTFGKLTKDQWGRMQYKHLDHHLRQFGV